MADRGNDTAVLRNCIKRWLKWQQRRSSSLSPALLSAVEAAEVLLKKLDRETGHDATTKRRIAQARWAISDIRDHHGDYEAARACLEPAIADIDRSLDSTDITSAPWEEFCYARALMWCSLMWSIAQHRDGQLGEAERRSRALQAVVENLVGNLPSSLDRPLIRKALNHLRRRVLYANARHLAAQGLVQPAESQFGKALFYCAERGVLAMDHYWTAMVLIGLARTFLEQGQLGRGQRLLLVAKVLLRSCEDHVSLAFVGYLLGSVHRQQGEYDEAVQSLSRAWQTFKEVGHERYFRRTRYELARTYFLKRDFPEARKVLAESLPSLPAGRTPFRGDRKAQERWQASDRLLQGRIALELADQLDNAYKGAKDCLALVNDHSADLRAQAHAVLGEVLLRQRRFSEAQDECHKGLDLNPVDITERAWLILVLCEVNLRREHFDTAKIYFDQWDAMREKVENRYVLDKGERLEKETSSRKAAFYVSYASPDVPYDELNRQLKAFLVRRLRVNMRGRTQEEQARVLGVSRQTYSNWISELREFGLLDDDRHAKS